MAIKTINEERLFQKLPFFFEKPSNVLLELAQNTARAGGTRLDITIEGRTLAVRDNGSGVANPAALFVLAESDWADSVEVQNPAGWGLYFILCLSESLTYRSRFGSITIDCEKYLKSMPYRENVLDLVDAEDRAEGFFLWAHLREGVEKVIMSDTHRLRFFPLDISVNGAAVEKGDLCAEADYLKTCPSTTSPVIKTTYEGNDVFIKVTKYLGTSPRTITRQMSIVWYGIPIECWGTAYVFVDVKRGSPLTPVLPYRSAIKEDGKLTAFGDFVRISVVEYCIHRINDPSVQDERVLVGLMETIENLATQDELDRLDRFYVKISEPHYSSDYGIAFDKLVSRGNPPLVNEFVTDIVLTGLDDKVECVGFSDSPDDLAVSKGTFVSADKPRKSPSWLKVDDKKYTIEIVGEGIQSHNYRWIKAREIKCQGKNLSVLATVEGSCYGTVVYAKTPEEVYEIEEAIFQSHVLVEDSDTDTRDTQLDNFVKELAEDIMRVTGRFRKRDLLSGLSVTGVKLKDVASVVFKRESAVIKLPDGRTRRIKIAA